jgi:GntR family transcriptional regulator
MMEGAIDPSDPTPLHEQVAAAIRRAISDGECVPGHRLPPARDLAAVLGVNSNTVLRALRNLRDEGLLEFRRGRGITVTATAPEHESVISMAQELVRLGRRLGYRRRDLATLIETLP